MSRPRDVVDALQATIVGQREVVEALVLTLIAGGHAFGIPTPADLSALLASEPAATTPISGSLSATATGTTIADGVLVTYDHGVWVSEGDKLFPFRSMGQLMADGYGGTPSVSVGTLAGLATVTAYAGS